MHNNKNKWAWGLDVFDIIGIKVIFH